MKQLPRFFPLLLLLGSLFLSFVSPSHSAEKANRQVNAGIFNFEGYHSLNENGGLEGYGIDLLSLLSEYSNLNFNLKGFENSWQDMQEMLKNGEIDIVSSARRNPEREKVFIFSLPVGRNNTVLSKKLDNRNIHAGDYYTYNGMKIGVLAGSSQNRYIENFAKDKGFVYTVIEFESPTDLAEALQKGEVDAILSSNLRKPDNETVLDIIKSDNFYILARPENQDIIDEINYAIEQMNLNEGDWQNDIYFRYYGPANSRNLEFSQREKDFIKASNENGKKIRAIGRMDLPPYSYVEDGTLKGILPEVFEMIMKNAGLPYELIAPSSDEDYDKKVASEEVDIVLDRLNPDLIEPGQPLIEFLTEPYVQAGLAKVSKNDHQGPDKIVALPEHAPYAVPERLLKDMEIKYYPTAYDVMQAVKKGEADTAYVLPLTAQIYINRNSGNDLFFTVLDDIGANFRMQAPATTEHEIITILKKGIKKIPPGAYNRLSAKYISFNAKDMTLSQYLYANPEIMLFGMLAIMLAASLIAIFWVWGRMSKKVLENTKKSNRDLSEQLAIVDALSRDYTNMLSINADTGDTGIVKPKDKDNGEEPQISGKEFPYDEIIDNYINKNVYPEDRANLSQALSLKKVRTKLAGQEEYSGTYRILKDGEIQYFQFTYVWPESRAASDGNLILAGFRNIDEVMRREQEQKRVLEDALARSRYASAAKTAFLNNMSHDIRTPMNAIIGFTALASANTENETLVRRYLDKIMTSGNHLLNLINDVLNMSRIESGKVKIKEEEVLLPKILHDLRTIVQADLRAKKLDFRMEAEGVRNESIYCDRLRLNQVLLNVLSNAIKYTPSGGKVNILLRQTALPVEGRAPYEFRIRDNGIGMSKEFLEHVFEPFEREQTSTVSGIEGTGLGLAITKNIVNMMGGRIEVESELDKGSEFIIRFNFRVVANKGKQKALQQFVGKRALVALEDESACADLVTMLDKLGLLADWTNSGQEALVLAKAATRRKSPYDVCLIGWKQADLGGSDLIANLRKIIPANCSLIVFSSQDIINMEEEAKTAGANALCSRPIFLSELEDILVGNVQENTQNNDNASPSIFKDKRILLVEDNEMNQEIAQMILEDAGFELDIVENGKEAVEQIENSPPDKYALILMDVQMPVMNGYEATKQIRAMQDEHKANIPIIAMTANAFDEDREQAVKSGMNGYVAKPIDIQVLLATLSETLEEPSESHL